MRRVIGSSLLILGLAGCDFLSDPPLTSCGTFAGRASGASTDSIVGCAFYSNHHVTGEFGMVLTHGRPPNPTHQVKLFSQAEPGAPNNGTPAIYAVGGDTSFFTGVIFVGNRTFSLTGGTVSILWSAKNYQNEAQASAKEGSLNVTATEVGGTEQIVVTGSFNALCTAEVVEITTERNVEGGHPCDFEITGFRTPTPTAVLALSSRLRR